MEELLSYEEQLSYLRLYTDRDFPNIDMRLAESQIIFKSAVQLVPEHKTYFEHALKNWRNPWEKTINDEGRVALNLLKVRLIENLSL